MQEVEIGIGRKGMVIQTGAFVTKWLHNGYRQGV